MARSILSSAPRNVQTDDGWSPPVKRQSQTHCPENLPWTWVADSGSIAGSRVVPAPPSAGPLVSIEGGSSQ